MSKDETVRFLDASAYENFNIFLRERTRKRAGEEEVELESRFSVLNSIVKGLEEDGKDGVSTIESM